MEQSNQDMLQYQTADPTKNEKNCIKMKSKLNIIVENPYRIGANKINIRGAVMVNAKLIDQNTQQWQMNDGSNIVMKQEEIVPKICTKFTFVWYPNDGNGNGNDNYDNGGVGVDANGDETSKTDTREVRFYYSFDNAIWFPTYMNEDGKPNWPMNTKKQEKQQQKSQIKQFPFNTPHQFEKLVEHLLFNSNGFALQLDRFASLFIHYLQSPLDKPILAISVKDQFPYYTGHRDHDHTGQIRFCMYACASICAVYQQLASPSLRQQLIPSPNEVPNEQMFANTVWSLIQPAQLKKLLPNSNANVNNRSSSSDDDDLDDVDLDGEMIQTTQWFTQAKVLRFAQKLRAHGFTRCTLILSEWWQNTDRYAVDTNLYPNMRQLVERLHHEFGYKIYLDIWEDCAERPEFAVKSGGNEFGGGGGGRGRRDVPLIKTIDHTIPHAVRYYHSRLIQLQREYGIDSFYFSTKFSTLYPRFLVSNDPEKIYQKHPRLYANKMVEFAQQFATATTYPFVRIAGHSQNVKAFYCTGIWNPYWSELKSMISRLLTTSIAGYSFTLADGMNLDYESKELYIRWCQAITFMPVMHLLQPPWCFDDQTVEIVQTMVRLHYEYVPKFLELSTTRVQDGDPIIRPMWYLEPNDPKVFEQQYCAYQFALGNDLVVAPVLDKGARMRTLYLPSGVWIDQHGVEYQGSTQVTVDAPLAELPYFKRKI